MRVVVRRTADRRPRHSRELRWGAVILAVIVAMCLLVPVLHPWKADQFVGAPFSSPSWRHPFGTDSFGRDVFVRVWAGGRLDLFIATVVVSVSLIVGTLLGIVSGAARRRWLDTLLMRFVDGIVAFPFLVLLLVLIVVVGSDRTFLFLPAGAPAVIVAILLVDWTVYARLARTETLSLRERDFVTAGRTLGYSQTRIVRKHLLPGVLRVTASFAVADAILVVVATASLSFLGAGIQAPAAEWGAIMFEGRAVLATSWWITVIPGAVLALTGVALGLVADALLGAER